MLGFGLILALSGCVDHTFAPGPGMSVVSFEPDAARCRLMARGMRSGFGFAAAGSQNFVAASVGGAVLGYAIGSAVEQNANYNDCMEARGWRIADGSRPLAVVTPVASFQPASALVSPATVASPAAPPAHRDFGARVTNVTYSVADNQPPHGVMIMDVADGAAASAAGLRGGDVILSFNGSSIIDINDMQQALIAVGHDSTATVYVRRADQITSVQMKL